VDGKTVKDVTAQIQNERDAWTPVGRDAMKAIGSELSKTADVPLTGAQRAALQQLEAAPVPANLLAALDALGRSPSKNKSDAKAPLADSGHEKIVLQLAVAENAKAKGLKPAAEVEQVASLLGRHGAGFTATRAFVNQASTHYGTRSLSSFAVGRLWLKGVVARWLLSRQLSTPDYARTDAPVPTRTDNVSSSALSFDVSPLLGTSDSVEREITNEHLKAAVTSYRPERKIIPVLTYFLAEGENAADKEAELRAALTGLAGSANITPFLAAARWVAIPRADGAPVPLAGLKSAIKQKLGQDLQANSPIKVFTASQNTFLDDSAQSMELYIMLSGLKVALMSTFVSEQLQTAQLVSTQA
jgi:hypothetical protein